MLQLQAALDNGWNVVTSDYEGLNAGFVAGVMAGHGVLDSIRASLNETATAITGLSPTAHYAMFGYSGGALASEWAAELAPVYAPDLTRFIGTAIGGLTPNVTSVMLATNGTSHSSLDFAGTLGLSRAYANLSSYVNQQLIPSKAAAFYSIASTCGSSSNTSGDNQDFFSYFTSGAEFIHSDVWKTVASGAGQMGVHGVPKIPMYIFKAIGDEVSPVDDTDQLVQKYCQKGVTIEYTRNTFGEHATEAILGLPAAYQWIQDRFNGVSIRQRNNYFNCEIRNTTIIEIDDSGAMAAFRSNLTAELKQAYKSTMSSN